MFATRTGFIILSAHGYRFVIWPFRMLNGGGGGGGGGGGVRGGEINSQRFQNIFLCVYIETCTLLIIEL